MTNEELETIEARLSKITPGKWTATDFDVHTDTPTGVWNTTQICPVTLAMGKNEECYQSVNAAFIANAPGDIRTLIDEIRRLKTLVHEQELAGLGAVVLVAEIERLKAARRVFVWERAYPDSDDYVFARMLIGDVCIDLGYKDGDEHAFVYMRDEYALTIRLAGPVFDAAEKLIRELGFARDGDTFDRSKVTP